MLKVLLLSFALVTSAFAETPNLLEGVHDKYFKDTDYSKWNKSEDITFDVPSRALDGRLVDFNFSVTKHYKNISIVVEGNPHPLPGIGSLAITMHPTVAPFKFATHIRVEQNTYVDVIALTDDDHYVYNQVEIRSAGGCSGGVTYDADAVLKTIGEYKVLNAGTRTSVQIKHPQHNGFQPNLSNYTGLFILPEWRLTDIKVFDNDKVIFSGEMGGGSLSENPYFLFDTPKLTGQLHVIATDTKGNSYAY